tara:strand:+ start:765 stop:1085 length:321 start_codon:yes stop_codon:yes gene_type:complete
MKTFLKYSFILGTLFLLTNCSKQGNSNTPNIKSQPPISKEFKTLYLPIGGYQSGFLYCGFDGNKDLLSEFTANGWLVKSITPQNFQTLKRNGETVICNGNNYILEK